MKKRMIAVLLCVCTLVTLLAGCGSKDTKADNEPVEIVMSVSYTHLTLPTMAVV